MIAGLWDTYQDYLLSPIWMDRRNSMLAWYPDCYMCGKPATTVHHLNYDHVGNEGVKDLMSLCFSCHEFIHAKAIDIVKTPPFGCVLKNGRI